MTLNILDVSPVNLDGSITSTSDLDLAHDGDSLSDNNDKLLDELRTLNDAEFVVPDFTVGSDTHEVHAWEVLSDGSLSKWQRSAASSVSGLRDEMDADVVVVAVPPGVSVPQQPQPNGPPAPGTKQKKVRIKVGPTGSLPIR